MSTAEALDLDSAVERFLAPEGESAQSEDAELESAADSLLEDTDEETDVDSEVDNSDYDEDDSEYDEDDTDDESADEYEDDEPDQDEPSKFTVKVDGEEVEVTLEDLKRSYSGQGKIQKGMQEAAEIRKRAIAEHQQAQAVIQNLTAMYQRVQETGFIQPPREPDPSMFEADPLGYMEQKIQFDQQAKAYNAQQNELRQLREYQAYQEQERIRQHVVQELTVLQEKIPELNDPEAGMKLRDQLERAGAEYGYSQQELAGITDHRALMILRDAMRWRTTQAKRSQVEKKAKGARPVIKPQAKKTVTPKAKKARQSKSELKRTGSLDAALRVLGVE